MKSMKIMQPGGKFELIQEEIAKPGPQEVRVKVMACGICHSDVMTQQGSWPGIHYPRSPGHEIAGIIDEIGSDVRFWKKGQRVGVGWNGGYCGHCASCRRGDFITCSYLKVPGIHYDGGYTGYVIVPDVALAALPDQLSFEDAAPLLCAGVTTYNALRHSEAKPGDVVAIQGIGGLGHLAIQFSNKMGFKTVAISRGNDKESLAQQLGAHVYIDSEQADPAKALMQLGGAKVILSTVTSGKAMSPLIDGLGRDGQLIVIGVGSDPIEVTPLQLIVLKRHIQGWAAGNAADSEDTLNFCVLTGIRPMIEKFPIDQVQEAYDKMLSEKARFRVVLLH